ncbi:MAG: hypothetical protein M1818_003472 [Claussenomyces sp. TS43310]|nr:MAG: hypothetical protein M1818_003472 [Claussenomyces sp. TS43310]
MVSLWPWKGDDSSPAVFEKTLSTLSAKISKSQLQLDGLRQNSRRFKALWTLYSSFAYLLCVVILGLVVGWKNWSVTEYSALAGSPVIIYLVRASITTYYTFRIDSVTSRMEEQTAERAKTIDKLKAATKYNSTQQLLEKYGGAPPQPSPRPKSTQSRKPKQNESKPQRTGMGPPPTANIPRNQPMSPQPSTPKRMDVPHLSKLPKISSNQPGPPEFAPNAFPAMPQYDRGSELSAGNHWYDRVLDLLLGDDETSPKNRVVLICKTCRLVNGQAPPGVKRLEELGKWRCNACGAWNGEEDESAKIVAEIKGMEKARTTPEMIEANRSGEDSAKSSDDVEEPEVEESEGSEAEVSEAEERVSEIDKEQGKS